MFCHWSLAFFILDAELPSDCDLPRLCPFLLVVFSLGWWWPLNPKGFDFDEVHCIYFCFVACAFPAVSKKLFPNRGACVSQSWAPCGADGSCRLHHHGDVTQVFTPHKAVASWAKLSFLLSSYRLAGPWAQVQRQTLGNFLSLPGPFFFKLVNLAKNYISSNSEWGKNMRKCYERTNTRFAWDMLTLKQFPTDLAFLFKWVSCILSRDPAYW